MMIGHALDRVDGPLKVTGRATYASSTGTPANRCTVHRRRDDR
jgi:CO/xanthine dehydrogenase Mo-binding subunit